jgi:hypothetical protein
MEAVLGVAMAVLGGGSIAAIVALALKNSSRADQLLASRDVIDGYIKQIADTTADRDAEKAARVKAEAELATVRAQLAATQSADATKAEKEAQHVADEVSTAADAADALDDLLQESARVPGDDAAPTGAGDRPASKPAV